MSIFIAFEGPECAGKTTQIQKLVNYFLAKKIEVVLTREPGGTKVGERVRALFLDPEITEMSPMTEALLMLAQRRQHVEEVILPALQSGKVVLSDRFTLSTLAYQGYGRGLPLDMLYELSAKALNNFTPNISLVFDLPVAESLSRLKQRGGADRMEQADTSFFSRVTQGFRLEMLKHQDSYKRIDATKSIEQVHKEIVETILPSLPKPILSKL